MRDAALKPDAVVALPVRRLRLPSAGWILLATVALMTAAAALRFGLPIYRQQDAVDRIRAAGGRVWWGHAARTPPWINRLLPERVESRLRPVMAVRLPASLRNDAGLTVLRGLPNLETLDLTGANLTDAGLAYLWNCRGLREVDLRQSTIADADLLPLQSITALRRVNLTGTGVTTAGYDALRAARPDLEITFDDE